MPSKRRNNGRAKKNKGHANRVVCLNCHRQVAKDKAIKRFAMKKLVDESSKKDIEDNYAYTENFHLPKIYLKMCYCVSCAIHARVVRVRSQTRGDRDRRYTTKLRNTKDENNRTGGFAVPAPNLVRKNVRKPAAPRV
jgi:small subunit ribosomal protein S26e